MLNTHGDFMRQILNGLGDVYGSEDSSLAEKEILICKESVKDAKKSGRPVSRKPGKLQKLMAYSGVKTKGISLLKVHLFYLKRILQVRKMSLYRRY